MTASLPCLYDCYIMRGKVKTPDKWIIKRSYIYIYTHIYRIMIQGLLCCIADYKEIPYIYIYTWSRLWHPFFRVVQNNHVLVVHVRNLALCTCFRVSYPRGLSVEPERICRDSGSAAPCSLPYRLGPGPYMPHEIMK